MLRTQFNNYVRLVRNYFRNSNNETYRKMMEYERDLLSAHDIGVDELYLIGEIAKYSVYKKDVTYDMMCNAYLILGNKLDMEEENALSNTDNGTDEIGD